MSDRLRLAVENGHVVLPEDGDILVLNPQDNSDLSIFDSERTFFESWSARRNKALEAANLRTHVWSDLVAAAVLFLPRAREAQRAAFRRARQMTDGPIIIDGDKTDGVDAFYRELRDRAEVSPAWSKAHGKVFTVEGGDISDWPELAPYQAPDGWWRAPGVFSADGIDKASAFLADALPKSLSGTVIDLGAGWGYISHEILKRDGVTELHLVEDDCLALRAAGRNVTDPRAKFHGADALTWRPDTPADHVVTNPPFHQGRAAEPSLGQAFIRAAAGMLKPKGQLWLVANRYLPYEKTLKDAFRTVELHAENPSFKIFHATSPNRRKV